MALEKIVGVDRIEVLENGCVQVRTKTAIMEGGAQISGTFHRHVVAPGDDYSAEDDYSTHMGRTSLASQEYLASQEHLVSQDVVAE